MLWLATTALAFDVQVHGVEGSGTVGCAAFRTDQGFPGDPGKAAAVAQVAASKAIDGVVTCRFEGLVDGRVAVSVRHDVDDNGKLDTNAVGFPKEPYGFSRDAPLRTFGPPRFEDVVVDVGAPIHVTLRRP